MTHSPPVCLSLSVSKLPPRNCRQSRGDRQICPFLQPSKPFFHGEHSPFSSERFRYCADERGQFSRRNYRHGANRFLILVSDSRLPAINLGSAAYRKSLDRNHREHGRQKPRLNYHNLSYPCRIETARTLKSAVKNREIQCSHDGDSLPQRPAPSLQRVFVRWAKARSGLR